MIPSSGCPPWPPDHPRTLPRTGTPTPPRGARPPQPYAEAGTPELRPHRLTPDGVAVIAPAAPIHATSVDAPFRARGKFRTVVAGGRMLPSVDAPSRARENFRTVVARGRMLPSVRPLVRQRTAAGLYGSSRTGSKSQPRTRGTVVHTGYPDPVSPTVAPCLPSARPTPSRPRRAYAAGAGAL